MDRISAQERSRVMSKIKSSDTKPEIVLRRELFARGFRFRKNYTKLPGKPDIAFIRNKVAVFVNGCFWHLHTCKSGHIPKSNSEYWKTKLEQNVRRDNVKNKLLKKIGWKVKTIWECEINKDMEGMVKKLTNVLGQER